MTRGKGIERGRPFSRQRRRSGDCSTSVESSSRASHDMHFPAASAVDTFIRRKEANQIDKQYDSDEFSHGNYYGARKKVIPDDIRSEKPELEAYCDGSWWDVEILNSYRDNYYVHYQKFPDQNDQWVPIVHLRVRCRTSYLSDCRGIVPGIDVCVMTQHPHADQKTPAWYDARIIDLGRNPHTQKACKCWFQIALYTIPDILPSDFNQRQRLPVSSNTVTLRKMSIMREARSMSFHGIVAASLPGVKSSPKTWAKDGSRWYSSLDNISTSRDRSFSFESTVAGGSLDFSHSEGRTEGQGSPYIPFEAFLEEMEIKGNSSSVSLDGRDGDAVAVPVASDCKVQPIALDLDDAADCEINELLDSGIKFLDRYSSDESDERATSLERAEDIWDKPNPTCNSESLGYPGEDLDEVVVSDLQCLKPKDQIPVEPISVTPDEPSSSPSVQIVASVPVTIQPVEPSSSPSVQIVTSVPVTIQPVELAASSEDSDVDFAEQLEQNIDALPIAPTDEPTTSSENSGGDGFADYLEQSIARNVCAQQSGAENCGAKRNPAEKHAIKRRITDNHGLKRRRVNANAKFSFLDTSSKGRLKTNPSSRSVLHRTEQLYPKRTVKERSTVNPSRNPETSRTTLASFPIRGGKILDGIASPPLEDYPDELEGLLLDEITDLTVREILAHSKDASKTGCPPQVVKEKRLKKVVKEIAAFPKRVEKEITYAELFETVTLVQLDIPSDEKGSTEESGLLTSWNPLLESVGPALPYEVKDDPLADVWEAMRVAQKSEEEVNGWVKDIVEECTNLRGTCEHPDGSIYLEHGGLKFDQEVGEVCEVCGVIVNDIKDLWARDNAKRITGTREGNDDSDADNYACDQDILPCRDPDDEKQKQQNNIDRDSNIELIPDLAKHMQRHQIQGFQFLWRNLDGQGSIGSTCFEKGGCVLSHAPGTGKTFLIISFLHSYMKKYPKTRPLILAPKIMLQPWEREFRKWNVDIPVYNFNKADEQGRALFQQHEEAGRIRLKHSGRTQGKKLLVYREAMLWQWIETQSVLLISYPMFNNLYKTSPSDTRMYRIRTLILERPTLMILDEGHVVRNRQAQVLKQLNAVKTPLRVMLSGTLFQNNFEELYTCLNAVRSGFAVTFAKAAGLKLNIHQEIERQSDDESEQLAIERKEKAYKIAESQARKLFIEEIGNKIDKGQKTKASSGSLAQGLEQLRRLTSPFIHHYTGGVLRNLPPLRDFAIMFQPSALQEKMIQNLERRMGDKTMLERECLLSLVCIHPTLFSQHNVGKTLTDLLPPAVETSSVVQEMLQVASNRDPAVGVKTRFVIKLLKHLRHGQEKILIFCQNLDPLLLLEEMLQKQFGWVREREVLQIDGKVQSDERQSIIERFNDPNGRIRVLLASTKACGEGVTLTGASRVVFMDVLWNPAVIRQAIHRAFRIGQEKIVHVYRLVIAGTFEEGKYRRMVWKDHKSQAIFFENQETVEKTISSQIGFWEVKNQFSKDLALNELCRQDSESDQPEFKHIFRHGGFFDDDYKDDPQGKGTDATDWLRGIEGVDSFDLDTDEISGDDGDTEDFDGLDEDV